MVTPAIKKIKEVEKDCQKKLNEAHLRSEAMVQAAFQRKTELIARARKETQNRMEELAKRAQEDARRESKKISDREKEEINKLRESVKSRFPKSLRRIFQEMGIKAK